MVFITSKESAPKGSYNTICVFPVLVNHKTHTPQEHQTLSDLHVLLVDRRSVAILPHNPLPHNLKTRRDGPARLFTASPGHTVTFTRLIHGVRHYLP